LLLLTMMLPLQALAAQPHLLVISAEAEEGAADWTMQTIRQLAMYSNWNCRFEGSDARLSLEDCEGVIFCLEEDDVLPEKTAQAILESEVPVCVIGSGGLQQLAPVRHEHGTLVVRLETENHQNQDLLLKQEDITLLQDRGESLGGAVFVGSQSYPLCQTVGQVTHLAYFDADSADFGNYLASCLQIWRWPFADAPRGYGFYLLLDRVYPFDDPTRLMAITDMLEEENVPYALTVMPIYANGEYPTMRRFCEYLTYVQSRGAGIILHAPLVTLQNVSAEDIKTHINIAFEAYTNQGVYPLAIQAPESWLMSEKGLSVLTGFRTVFTYPSGEKVHGDKLNINLAYKDGHQLVAAARDGALTYTDAYAQAISLDINQDVEKLREQVKAIKRSRRTLKSLRTMQNIVYAGDNYLLAEADGSLVFNGKEQKLVYTPFVYEENYEFDRGFVQNLKEQIEGGNQLIMIFVVISCSFFIVAMFLVRRSIRGELLQAKQKKPNESVKHRKEEAETL
jgi:hypothetical protein